MPYHYLAPHTFVTSSKYRLRINAKEIKVISFTLPSENGATNRRSQILTCENGHSYPYNGILNESDAPLYGDFQVKEYSRRGKLLKTYSWKRKNPFQNDNATVTTDTVSSQNNTQTNTNNNRSKRTCHQARNAFDQSQSNTPNESRSNTPNNSGNTNNNTANPNGSNIPAHSEFFYYNLMNKDTLQNMSHTFKKYPKNKECISALQDMATAKKYNRFLKIRYYRLLELSSQLLLNGPSGGDLQIDYDSQLADMIGMSKSENNINQNNSEQSKYQSMNDMSNNNDKKGLKKECEMKMNVSDIDYCCACVNVIGCVCKNNKKSKCECLKSHWYYQIECVKDPKHIASQQNKCPHSSTCNARIKIFPNSTRLKLHILSLHSKDRRKTRNLSKICKNQICSDKFVVISEGKYKKSKTHTCSEQCNNGKVICGGELYPSWKAQRGKYLLRCRRCCQTLTPTDEEEKLIADNLKTNAEIESQKVDSHMKCRFCEFSFPTNELGKHMQLAHPM